MTRKMSRNKRKAAFLAVAEEMFEEVEQWYDAHPEATFGEIEQEARRRRRELMGKALEILVNGRDNGVRPEGVECRSCGEEMEFEKYLPWTVHGLEGDPVLERAYYVCPRCEGETFSPPRPEASAARGPLE
jgi:hypothetical protein